MDGLKHFGTLEILGFEESRGIIPLVKPGEKVGELLTTCNTVATLHVRMDGGAPFCVTVDGETFASQIIPKLRMEVDWEKVRLVGWYDAEGRGNLKAWDGSKTIRSFVITGIHPAETPVNGAPVPPSARLYWVPGNVSPKTWAEKLGGHHVIGWMTDERLESLTSR